MSNKTDSGKRLNKLWGVNAIHALYHKDGNWYNHLKSFPGAFFDPNGYILFKTEEEYLNNSNLKMGIEVNIAGSISSIPGYKKGEVRE